MISRRGDVGTEIGETVAQIGEAPPWDLAHLEGVEGGAGAGWKGRDAGHDTIGLGYSVEDLVLLLGANMLTAGLVGEPFAEKVAALFEVVGGLAEHDGSFDDLLLGWVEFADCLG
jgi:hypothetical protein